MQPYDSPEEAAFRAEVRAWLGAHASPVPPDQVAPSAIIAEWTPEEEERRLREAKVWQRLKFDDGWAGIAWPESYGGRGGTLIEQLIFHDEETKYDVPHDALAVGVGWCGPAVIEHGSAEQRDRFLRPLLSGDEVWCQLFSEPAAGSDLAGLGTRAIRDGDEWRITGQKVWTTFAHRSDWGLCIARSDPDVPKHRGMTAFMVDMHRDGIECRPVKQMTDSANFNEVFLDDVLVPDENRIAPVGDGWRVAMTTFMWERINLLAGGARLLDALQRLVVDEGRRGDPLVRDRFADLYTRIETIRFGTLRLMTAISQGRIPGAEGSMLKLMATTVLTDLYEFAVDLFGPRAMLHSRVAPWQGEWHGAFLGMPGLRIGGGTDQIQRNIIGERVLGLPPDIRVDKDIPFSEVPRSA